jgi:hypothetical protein
MLAVTAELKVARSAFVVVPTAPGIALQFAAVLHKPVPPVPFHDPLAACAMVADEEMAKARATVFPKE